MYYNLGRLPWKGIKAATKSTKKKRNKMIGEIKMSTPIEVLCKAFPRKYSDLNLQYFLKDKPDIIDRSRYEKLKQGLNLMKPYLRLSPRPG